MSRTGNRKAVERVINVTSGYGANTQKAFCTIEIPGQKPFQLFAEDARALGLNLLQAAEAAETDAFLVEFGHQRLNLDEAHAGVLLQEFRRWRNAQRAESEKTGSDNA